MMSNPSDDEDDFLSADEDGFGEDDEKKLEKKVVEQIERNKDKEEEDEEDSDPDKDEEALAERIRERNLKIARKFSAEIAKNVKASAPIPVKGLTPTGLKINDLDDTNIPDSQNKSSPPPAPPPTPALSSSFNSSNDATSLGSTPSATTSSQYSWRVPVKTKPKQADAPNEPKSEQTRLALDRLSNSLSQTDKNLFEKVAADIKKVSIRPTNATGAGENSSAGIPLISDLGGTLSGWNWNNATKLLSSASQVTSHIGTVFDSVSQHLQQPNQQSQTGQTVDERKEGSSADRVSASEQASEAAANDGLVDLTLNAMESLGKKAFGVMTDRNEAGLLEIKGIGRPWSHLMNVNKQNDDQNQEPQDSSAEEFESKTIQAPVDVRRRKKDQ